MWSFFIFANMKSKIITITLITIFSILLWGSVSLSGEYFTTLEVPIQFINLDPDYAIGDQDVSKVQVGIKTQGWLLASLQFGRDLELVVPVQEEPGRHSVSARAAIERASWLSSNMQIFEVVPDQVRYFVEKIQYKKVKVTPNFESDFKPGFGIVSNISIEPDSVVIYGPESKVDNIDTVSTEAINLSDIDGNYSENIKLTSSDNFSFDESNVHVSFEVQKIVDKTFEKIPVETRKVPKSLSLTIIPTAVEVVVRGGINDLATLSENDIQAFIYFDQALEDTLGVIEPHFNIPQYVKLIDVKPKYLQYIIRQF